MQYIARLAAIDDLVVFNHKPVCCLSNTLRYDGYTVVHEWEINSSCPIIECLLHLLVDGIPLLPVAHVVVEEGRQDLFILVLN